MADADYITVGFLKSIMREADEHPSRINYLRQLKRGSKYYSATDEWWVPMDGIDDENISGDEIPSRENVIYDTVNEANSILLKNDPIVRHHPIGHPELSEFTDDMDKILLAGWRRASTRHVLRSMHKEACICGLSIAKVGWNPANKRDNPDGEVMVVKIAPAYIRLDPYASNDHRGEDCRYFVHTTRQTPEAIVAKYGKDGVKALDLPPMRGSLPSSFSKLTEKVKKAIAGMVQGEKTGGERVDRRVMVHEFWLSPMTDTESELSIGQTIDEKVYPYGVVATLINEEIVRIMPNPFAKKRSVMMGEGTYAQRVSSLVGHKTHPFVMMYWSREQDAAGQNSVYECKGMVQQQAPLQFDVNRLGLNIMKNATTIANPGFDYIDDAISLPPGRITLPPGGGLPINAKYVGRIDDVIRWRNGREISSFAYDFWQRKKEAIREAGGIKGGMIGLEPKGTSHTTEGVIGGIQEASFSRMWSPSDELAAAVEGVGLRYLGLIQQYYKPGRWVDVSGQGEERFVQIQGVHLAGQFRVEVVRGTTTPLYDVDKYQRLALIKQTVDQAIATQNVDMMESARIYLVELDYPHAYQWIQLLEKKIAELQQQQQQLQQFGAMGIARSGALGGQQGTAAGGAPAEEEELNGIRALAEQAGVSEEELLAALER